jgi:phosphoserine phosphatase
VRIGAVDAAEFDRRNDEFFAQYQAGTLDPVEYLEFALGTLAASRAKLEEMQAQFMAEVVCRPSASARAGAKHLDAGDLVAIVTATNHFVTKPIAKALGVEHLIAAMPEVDAEGNLTGKLRARRPSGQDRPHQGLAGKNGQEAGGLRTATSTAIRTTTCR